MNKVIRFAPLSTVNELLQLYRIRPLKKLSQNFLLDLKLSGKIVKAAGVIKQGEVCEIGPGPGPITRAIMLKNPKRLVVIEKDVRFQSILQELSSASVCKFDIIFANVMDYNMDNLFDTSLRKEWNDISPNIHLIGNLPFNVSTPLIIRWLKDISLRRSAWSYGRVQMTLTFQEEVARRIISPLLSKSRCRLSVMCQIWCKPKHMFTIPGSAFVPKPKVDVGVVHFTPLREPVIPLEFDLIEKVIGTIFNNRQKYCFKPAGRLFPVEVREELTKRLFDIADVNTQLRPFQLSNNDWKSICFAYKEICDKDPSLYSYNYRDPKNSKMKDEEEEEEEEEEDPDSLYSSV